tara:strand:- start:1626 stop:3083 length:1458 start_codon:yes stop_codon:yes gene_type:complete
MLRGLFLKKKTKDINVNNNDNKSTTVSTGSESSTKSTDTQEFLDHCKLFSLEKLELINVNNIPIVNVELIFKLPFDKKSISKIALKQMEFLKHNDSNRLDNIKDLLNEHLIKQFLLPEFKKNYLMELVDKYAIPDFKNIQLKDLKSYNKTWIGKGWAKIFDQDKQRILEKMENLKRFLQFQTKENILNTFNIISESSNLNEAKIMMKINVPQLLKLQNLTINPNLINEQMRNAPRLKMNKIMKELQDNLENIIIERSKINTPVFQEWKNNQQQKAQELSNKIANVVKNTKEVTSDMEDLMQEQKYVLELSAIQPNEFFKEFFTVGITNKFDNKNNEVGKKYIFKKYIFNSISLDDEVFNTEFFLENKQSVDAILNNIQKLFENLTELGTVEIFSVLQEAKEHSFKARIRDGLKAILRKECKLKRRGFLGNVKSNKEMLLKSELKQNPSNLTEANIEKHNQGGKRRNKTKRKNKIRARKHGKTSKR